MVALASPNTSGVMDEINKVVMQETDTFTLASRLRPCFLSNPPPLPQKAKDAKYANVIEGKKL